MIEIHGLLVSVTDGSRVAQVSVDGRGITRIPLTVEQQRELAASAGRKVTLRLEVEAGEVVEATS